MSDDDFHAVIQSTPKDRKSTRLNSSHLEISYAVFCLKKKIELEKGGVTLVHVEDGGLDSQCAQHAYASDAEHELLPETVQAVLAVRPVGDCPRPSPRA